MRRKITVFFNHSCLLPLQSTVFQALSFASISPNLMIVVVSAFGFMRGKKEGLWIGFFTGLLLDVFTGKYSWDSTHCFICMWAISTDFFRKMFYPEDIKLPMLLIPELVYTLLISVVLYFIILKINQRLERIEKRSAAKFV